MRGAAARGAVVFARWRGPGAPGGHRGGYERRSVGEYWDDNWLTVRVWLSVGGFQGLFLACFQTGELVGFRDQLAALYATLKGEARFETLEDQLSLTLMGNGYGQVELKGKASDVAGIGNRLAFNLSLDQTHLAKTLRELNEVVRCFPERRS